MFYLDYTGLTQARIVSVISVCAEVPGTNPRGVRRENILHSGRSVFMGFMVYGICVSSERKSAEEQSYTVLPGDTLESIADRFEVDVEKILQRNRVSAFGLQPGSVLVLKPEVRITQIRLKGK